MYGCITHPAGSFATMASRTDRELKGGSFVAASGDESGEPETAAEAAGLVCFKV